MTFLKLILSSTMYYFFRKIFLHFSADKVGKNFRNRISHQSGHWLTALTKYPVVLTAKGFKKF